MCCLCAKYRTIAFSLLIRPCFLAFYTTNCLQILYPTKFLVENVFIYLYKYGMTIEQINEVMRNERPMKSSGNSSIIPKTSVVAQYQAHLICPCFDFREIFCKVHLAQLLHKSPDFSPLIICFHWTVGLREVLMSLKYSIVAPERTIEMIYIKKLYYTL